MNTTMNNNGSFFNTHFDTWISSTITINSAISQMNDGQIITPLYQRMYVWPPKQQQKFLKTIARGGLIPSIILNIKEDGTAEIVDGQNRLKTIQRFMNGELKAKFSIENDTGENIEVNMDYDDLSVSEKRRFKLIKMSAYELSNWSEEECQEMFMIVQYGVKPSYGEKLHSQRSNNFHRAIDFLMTNHPFITSSDGLNINAKRYKNFEFIGALIIAQMRGVSNSDMGQRLEKFMDLVHNGGEIINSDVITKIDNALTYYEKIFPLANRLSTTPKPNHATHLLNIYFIMNNFAMGDEELPDISQRLNDMMTVVQDSATYTQYHVEVVRDWGEDGRTHTQPMQRWTRIKPIYEHFMLLDVDA